MRSIEEAINGYCEAFINLTEKIIEILPDLIASVTANMPEAIEQYIELKGGDHK